jgi:phosphate uptake regulator
MCSFFYINMRRKVMKVANSSALISLPYRWIKEYNIKKGEELEVIEQGNSIIISTEKTISMQEVEIDLTNLDRTTIMYVIRSVYRLGYDTVRLVFKRPTTLYQRKGKEISINSIIHSEVNRLVGFEIMQESNGLCVVKDIQEVSGKDFDQVVRRVFLIMIDMMGEFISGAKDYDSNLLQSIENRHDTITKFISHCLRILSKKEKCVNNKYHIIATLDRITDIYKYSARDILESEKIFSKEAIIILEKVKEGFLFFYDLFYNYNNDTVLKINENRYLVEEMLKKLDSSPLEIRLASKHVTILEVMLDLIEARTALEY